MSKYLILAKYENCEVPIAAVDTVHRASINAEVLQKEPGFVHHLAERYCRRNEREDLHIGEVWENRFIGVVVHEVLSIDEIQDQAHSYEWPVYVSAGGA